MPLKILMQEKTRKTSSANSEQKNSVIERYSMLNSKDSVIVNCQ